MDPALAEAAVEMRRFQRSRPGAPGDSARNARCFIASRTDSERRWTSLIAEDNAHGLRKAGATIAAENGATEKQLMSIFGWSEPAQAAHYTRAARQKVLAGAAMALLVPGAAKEAR